MANIPHVLINANVYSEGNELLGVGTVELPDFEFMDEDVSGLGIAGELNLPVLGHFKSLTMNIKWNSVTEHAIKLLAPESHSLTIYASVQSWNTTGGKFEPVPVRVAVRTMPKKTGIGNFEPGKKMEPETELELVYAKVSVNGNQMLEIDKINFICEIDGTDYLADVRSQLGK